MKFIFFLFRYIPRVNGGYSPINSVGVQFKNKFEVASILCCREVITKNDSLRGRSAMHSHYDDINTLSAYESFKESQFDRLCNWIVTSNILLPY